MKKEENGKGTLYDGIRISRSAIDKIVFILSLTLVITIAVAVILSAKL